MITFFPGPSRVYPQIADFLQEAFQNDILSISHRSDTFNKMSEKTIGLLKQKLNIPQDYTIMYTSSATENWETIAQSLTHKASVHFYNGSFGEKWFDYAKKIRPESVGYAFDINEALVPEKLAIPAEAEIICLTQNETSTATQVRPELLSEIRQLHPDKLLAIDATSSIAGISLPFADADIWFGSVQKCFGMPAGLGLLICSPRAIARAQEIGDRKHYNSVLLMYDNIKKWQTSYTINVLAIYLLMRVLETMPNIDVIDAKIKAQATDYYNMIAASANMGLLIQNEAVRSDTVIAVQASKEQIVDYKAKAKNVGILLGSGYGSWKETTFRIANFPALQPDEIEQLQSLLKQW